jgi:hypothetical protein
LLYIANPILKKILYFIFAISLMGCADNKIVEEEVVEEEVVEDCGCIKTSYHRYFRNSSSNSGVTVVLATENVPCQDQEVQVTTAQANGGEYWYYRICCDNIDTIGSGCN